MYIITCVYNAIASYHFGKEFHLLIWYHTPAFNLPIFPPSSAVTLHFTMTSSSSSEQAITLNNILHSIQIKLSSSNYLLWCNQMLPLFEIQDLMSHIDGSNPAPPATITADNKSAPNPVFEAWKNADRKAIILLNASLTEDTFSETIGHETARAKWVALAAAYSNSSTERVQNLQDQLQALTRGDATVAEFSRKFKVILDQLAAIGHPVSESDKVRWFYRGLGPAFETFSVAIRAARPDITLRDLQSQAEGIEFFSKSVHNNQSSPLAFTAQQNRSGNYRGRGHRNNNRGGFRGNRGGRGRFQNTEICQWCSKPGHKANNCYSLLNQSVAQPNQSHVNEAQIAQAFQAQCHVTTSSPDWHVDTGATDHMVGSTSHIPHSAPSVGKNYVTFGNGDTLPISHKGSSYVNPNIALRDCYSHMVSYASF